MNSQANKNAQEILKWYSIMGVESVISEVPYDFSSKPEALFSNQVPQNNRAPTKIEPQNITIIEPPKKTATRNAKVDNITASAVEEAEKLASAAKNIAELKQALEKFEGCALKNTAQNIVFAEGVESPVVMLIGEAPGATEDEEGKPFCGESGILLDNALRSVGLSRKENAYITNTVFWRPPGNRRPTKHELAVCKPFLEKHIELVRPKLLILVGSTAATSMLDPKIQISNIRQNYYNYTNPFMKEPIPTTAIFHPAFLMRQPSQKRTMWHDLLRIKDFLRA